MDLIPSFRRYLHLRTALDAHPLANPSCLLATSRYYRQSPLQFGSAGGRILFNILNEMHLSGGIRLTSFRVSLRLQTANLITP